MASSIHETNRLPNGHGKVGAAAAMTTAGSVWYGNGLDEAGLQRPRRLSFNGSDMELSALKAAGSKQQRSAEKKIEPLQMLALLAIATTLAFFIPYLHSSFDSTAFFRTLVTRLATTVTAVWQDFSNRLAYLRQAKAWSFERMFAETENLAHFLYAIAFGLLVSSFTWYVIYLDSSIPGLDPPTPFSSSKKRYRGGLSKPKERRFHLGYITAMVSGVVAFLIAMFA